MSNKEKLLKAFRIAANVVTDSGVLFQAANTIFNWTTSGIPGVVFNLAALTICAGLRLAFELKKDVPQPLEENLFHKAVQNPNTSLLVVSAAQFIAMIAAVPDAHLGNWESIKGAAMPMCFAVGCAVAPLNQENIRSKLAKTILTKEVYFAAGMIMAGASWAPAVVFGAAGALAVYRNLSGKKAGPDPLYLLSGGNSLAVIANAGNIGPMVALGSNCVAYLSIKAGIECGGISEAVQAGWARIRGSSRNPQPC
ncbi:MAG: hypothetical protein SFW62_04515 [Alphaproteobacteria bacterium]|nr:hypothetical protein [Alphaproteobacteria bacterium]